MRILCTNIVFVQCFAITTNLCSSLLFLYTPPGKFGDVCVYLEWNCDKKIENQFFLKSAKNSWNNLDVW